jgi:hypothetical protein
MTHIRELVHKRILVATKESRGYSSQQIVTEVLVMEVSPSGNFTKLRDMDGRRHWRNTMDIVPLEVLSNLETKPE